MRPTQLAFFTFVAALAWCGCSSHKPAWTSEHQRSVSFEASSAIKVADQPLATFLKQRTAVLLSGLSMSAFKSADQVLCVECSPQPNQTLVLGHAAPIDTDGYFLTAAHCVNFPINYLVYSDGESARISIPRVVAKISGPAPEFDIAIIHVDTKLRDIFPLASPDEYHVGCPAVGAGSSQVQLLSSTLTNWGILKNVCFAGRVISLRHRDGLDIAYADLPVRGGDSGGPLVSVKGKLMGIHCGEWTGWFGKDKSVAALPSSSCIAHLIEQDRRQLANKTQIDPAHALTPLKSFNNKTGGIVVWLNPKT